MSLLASAWGLLIVVVFVRLTGHLSVTQLIDYRCEYCLLWARSLISVFSCIMFFIRLAKPICGAPSGANRPAICFPIANAHQKKYVTMSYFWECVLIKI